MNEEKLLREIVSEIYERRSTEIEVSPAWLATEAMREIDPERLTPRLAYVAAHLELRQIARSFCRRRFEDDETEQHDLFPDLQTRYPRVHESGEEPRYVLLEHMTEEDVEYNVARLRAEAATKMRHADALEAWWQDRAA